MPNIKQIPFSEFEDSHIKRLIASGKTIMDVATYFQKNFTNKRTYYSISCRAKQLGLQIHKSPSSGKKSGAMDIPFNNLKYRSTRRENAQKRLKEIDALLDKPKNIQADEMIALMRERNELLIKIEQNGSNCVEKQKESEQGIYVHKS